jgi:hypothetical protein
MARFWESHQQVSARKSATMPIAAIADGHGGDLGRAAEKYDRLSVRRTPRPTGDPLTTVIGPL